MAHSGSLAPPDGDYLVRAGALHRLMGPTPAQWRGGTRGLDSVAQDNFSTGTVSPRVQFARPIRTPGPDPPCWRASKSGHSPTQLESSCQQRWDRNRQSQAVPPDAFSVGLCRAWATPTSLAPSRLVPSSIQPQVPKPRQCVSSLPQLNELAPSDAARTL